MVTFISVNTYIEHGDYFRIDKSIKNVIIGPSTSEQAFNDSLISETQNLSSGGTNYFYKYYQIKKVLECNPQITNVFIDVPNFIFNDKYNENIYDAVYMHFKYPNTALLMNYEDNYYLARNNFMEYLKSIRNAVMLNVRFLNLCINFNTSLIFKQQFCHIPIVS
ncbi:MAG: hypothetical protein WCK02_16790, partial [Bacteroidota bacterium]